MVPFLVPVLPRDSCDFDSRPALSFTIDIYRRMHSSTLSQVRGPLIPGMMAVKAAAKAAGAFGCTISGAGPTAVAITDNPETAQKVSGSIEGGEAS